MPTNRQIVLDSRPAGPASENNFRLVSTHTPDLQDGQLLVRHHYLSLDPYMRGRMNEAKSYATPQPLGQVMVGATAGEVLESRCPDFAEGDWVVGRGGWQEYSVVDGAQASALRKVDPALGPLSLHLGALGAPGIAAWVGLTTICTPQAGETVAVSAATGAVGSAVAALARARGCRTVGIAGGREKCSYAVRELGYDACIDYKLFGDAGALSRELGNACPRGIDCYFENVGGMVQEAVMEHMNAHGRMAVCGLIAGYDGASLPMARPQWILSSRLRVQGFAVGEHMDRAPEALRELSALVQAGKLRARESVAHGIAAAPAAFIGLLQGRNLGKQLVRLV